MLSIKMVSNSLFVFGLLTVGFCELNSTNAASVSLMPIKDNSIFEESINNSNALGELFSGNTNSGNARRALLSFDISDIPSGSTIDSVSISLNVTKTVSGFVNMSFHRLTKDWGEGTSNSTFRGGGQGTAATTGDVTWLRPFHPATLWTPQGGEFDSTISATQAVGFNGSYTWSGTGLVSDVQSWLDGTNDNFGWILIGNEATFGSAKRFSSRETLNPALRPNLTINFTPGSTAIPGDLNDDDLVNETDLGLFAEEFGRSDADGFSDGDFDGDNKAGLSDLLIIKKNFTPIGEAPIATAVPEPNSIFLAILGLFCLAITSIRRRFICIAA